MKFLLVSGSFHSQGRSLAILKSCETFFAGHTFETPTLNKLPIYTEDLNQNKPAEILQALADVESADGILFCTPEYNHSIPAVLKNWIDWMSRPAFNSVLKDMPVSIITQADSPVGGARVQAHMKLVLDSTLAKIHVCHEMMITGVGGIFDDDMNVVDANVLRRLERHIKGFIQYTQDNR